MKPLINHREHREKNIFHSVNSIGTLSHREFLLKNITERIISYAIEVYSYKRDG